jgi:hypothetical protein
MTTTFSDSQAISETSNDAEPEIQITIDVPRTKTLGAGRGPGEFTRAHWRAVQKTIGEMMMGFPDTKLREATQDSLRVQNVEVEVAFGIEFQSDGLLKIIVGDAKVEGSIKAKVAWGRK